MYAFEEMIDMGLKENQKWKSDIHRFVAARIAICNPNVKSRDTLTEIAKCVNKVPTNKIKTITYDQLVSKYHCPNVGIYE